MNNFQLVLASSSPQRRSLLAQLTSREFTVFAPGHPDRPDFSRCRHRADIRSHVTEIATTKWDWCRNNFPGEKTGAVIIAADTIVVGEDSRGRSEAFGKPPEGPNWPLTVRRWFQDYYGRRTHHVLTAVVVSKGDAAPISRVVETAITMHKVDDDLLEWYLSTEESVGKAGGYAIQGLGSMFVERLEGSLTNVIGLPLEALREMLVELGVDV